MKKYIIALGTFGIAASPMITVVSCSKPKKSKVTETDETNKTNNKGLEVKVNKFIKEYFTSKKDEVKDSINTARKKSNTQVELIESIIKQLSEKTYSFWILSTPDQESRDSEIVKQTIESVLRSKLKISKDSPKKYFHHENLYKLSFGKTEIFKGKLKKLDANLDFYKNINSLLPTAIKTIESVDGNTTLKEFFVKNSSLIEILKERLTKRGIAPGEVEQLLEDIYSLDFKISDIKKIHLALNKIIHNVDFDLSKLKNSENVLEQVIALTKDKDVILDSKELNEGMQGLISAMADLTLRNKENIPAIINMINIFKPGTISTKFASVILSVSKTNIFNEFFNALKNITIEQVQVLEDNILNITKSTDWINFDIFKFITNEKNQEIINNILKTLSLGQKTDEIKNVQEIALTLEKIAKKLKLDLSVLIKNKGEGIFNKLISLISSDEFKNLNKDELSKDVSHLIKNLISLISSESDNIDNIIELINSLKPNLISSNMKKIITIIVKSDVMKDLAKVKEETLNKILHLDFSVDDILGLLKKWLKLPKDASFIDVFKGLSGTLKQIGVLSDKQIEIMNKLMGSDFVNNILSKPGVIKKLKEIFEYNFKKINLNFLVKIIKDFKETKDFKATLTNVLKDLVNDKSNLESIKLIATESINYLLTINNKQFTNINDLLKLVNEMGLISADMVKKIKATLNDDSFKEFVINNSDLIKAVKDILLNPLNSPKAKALVQKIVKDLINKDRKALIKDAMQYFVYNKNLNKNMQAIFKSFVTKVLVLDNGKLTNVNLLLETYKKAKPNSKLAKKLGIILGSKFVKDVIKQPKVIAKVKEMILQNADKLTLASVKKIIDLMKNGKSNEVTQFIIKTILDDEKNIASLKLIVKESINYLLTIDNEEFVNINSLLILAKKMGLVSDKQLAKINKATKSPIFKLFITNNKELIKVFKGLLLNPLKSIEINALLKKMVQDLIKQDRKALIDDAMQYFVDANAKDGLLDNDLQKVFKSFVAKVLITDGQGNLTNVKLLLNTLEKMNPTSEVLKKLRVILNSKFAKDIFSQPKVIAKIQEILNYNIEKLNLEGVKKILELVKGKKYDQITEIIFKVALGDETNFANIKLIFKESINYLFTLDSKGKYAHLNSLLNIAKELKLITPTIVPQIMDILNGKVFKTFVIDNPEIINVFKQLIFSPLDKPETKVLIKKMIQDLIKQDRKALIDDAMQYFVNNPKLGANMQAIFKSFVTKVLVIKNGELTNVNLLLETYIKAKPNSELAKKLGIILNSKFVKDILNQPKVIAKVKEMILQNADKLTLASVKKIIDLMKNGKSNEVTQFIIKTILEDKKNIASLKLIVNQGMDYLLTIKEAEFANINNLLELAKQMKLVSEETITKLKSAISNPMFKAFVVNNKNIIQILKDLLLKPLESQNAKLIIQKMIQDLINKDHKALIQDAINYFAEGSKDGTLGAALQKVFKSFVTKVLLTDNQGHLTNIDLLVGTLIKMNPKSKLLGKLKTILNSKFATDIFKQPNVIAKIKEILNYNIDKLNLEGIKKMINLVKGKKYDKITEIIFKSALEDETNHKNIQLIITESINYLLTINNNKFSNLNELLKSLSNSGFMSKKLVAKISKIINTPLVEKLIQDEKGFVDAILRLVNDNFASLTEEQILNIFIALKDKNYSLLTKNILKANLFANAQSVEDLKLILEKTTEFILAKNSENKIGDNIKLLLDAMKKYGLFSDKITKIETIMNTDIIKALLTDKNVNDSIKKLIDINIKKLSVEKVREIFEAFSQGKLKETLVKIVNKDVIEDADSVAEINVVIKSMLTFALKISDKKEFANLNQLLESLKFIKSLSKPITSFQKMLKSDLFIDLSKRDGFITALTELIKINIGNFDSASTKKILNLMTKKDYAGMINALVESNLSNPEAMKHLSAIVGIVIDYALTLNDKGELGNISKILKLVGENSKFGKIITVITDNLTKDGFFKNFLANKKDFILNFKKTLKSVATKLMEPGMLNKVMGILKGDGKISVKLKTLWNTTGIFSKEDKEFITDTLKAIIATLGSVLANDKLSLNDIKEAINKIKIDGSIKKQMLQFISLFLTKGEKDASIQSVIKKLHNVVIHINPKKLLSILDILEDKKISKKDKFLRILEMPDLILDKDNKDHVHKDLKGLTKELTINVLTNMLDGGNLNHYKESFELFGIKLNKSKWDNITNLLKFAFTGNDGKFDYAKVRGFIKAIVDNANLDINSIQKVINYFASDAFSLKVKNSTGILGKARLFFSIINQKDILAMMKDKKKFISSINKFGLFIVKNVIDKLGDKSQIEVNAQTFTKLGLFSSIKNARIILKALISTFKDLKIMINDQGNSDGKTKENHLAYAGNLLGIMLLNTWLNHRDEIAKAFDDTKSAEWKKKHITYTEVVKFISDLSGREMVGAKKSKKKDPLWIHLSYILSLTKKGSLIKMTLGQLLFIANYDENGERAEGDNIYKKIDKITENWKGSMNGVDSLFANLSKMHKILENNNPSYLLKMNILSQELTFGTLLKNEYFKNEKIKKLLRDWIVGLGFAKEGKTILTRDSVEWNKKVQTAAQSLLHDLLYIKIGIGEDLFDLTALNTFLKNPLLNKILKMLKI